MKFLTKQMRGKGENKMTKLKITIKYELEYEPNPNYYPENNRTPEKMLALDLANTEDDPYLTIENGDCTLTIIGEIIDSD